MGSSVYIGKGGELIMRGGATRNRSAMKVGLFTMYNGLIAKRELSLWLWRVCRHELRISHAQ